MEYNGKAYTFDAMEEDDDYFDTCHIYIGDTKSYINSCVFIDVDKTDVASLNNAAYRPVCATNKQLERGVNGTVIMLQGAIKYVFDKYKHVSVLELSDETMVPHTKINITIKRLLRGQPAWYQQYLQATPGSVTTRKLLKELQSEAAVAKINQYRSLTDQSSWGTEADIEKIVTDVAPMYYKYIHGTKWQIDRATSQAYPVTYSILPMQSGGELQHLQNKRVAKHIRKIYESKARLAYFCGHVL
jgi:hypothetical protein